ncbi:MAG: phosphatidylserine decarboxylase [Verrucomicrobiales bacterium]|nr:phosphatidylserine decarboxylase [Verrucomicrobiales bacterium]MEC7357549.1 phosphatidylserine decarboxylase [Verrucomicrobiota bacterium]
MAKILSDWVNEEVSEVKGRSVRWLSERHFFRDPMRSIQSDTDYFFSPADGVIIYQRRVSQEDSVIEIKGQNYTLKEALRDPNYSAEFSLVIGIFMTFYDVHINRVPYPGILSYRELEPIDSFNKPMLAMENSIVDDLTIDHDAAEYLHCNQRVLNKVDSLDLGLSYYILQIADYDVDSITPFDLSDHRAYQQNERFSQIRYGSQVDLIIPLDGSTGFELLLEEGHHVEAGVDPLLKIKRPFVV